MNNPWSVSKKVEGIQSEDHLKKVNKQTTENSFRNFYDLDEKTYILWLAPYEVAAGGKATK